MVTNPVALKKKGGGGLKIHVDPGQLSCLKKGVPRVKVDVGPSVSCSNQGRWGRVNFWLFKPFWLFSDFIVHVVHALPLFSYNYHNNDHNLFTKWLIVN